MKTPHADEWLDWGPVEISRGARRARNGGLPWSYIAVWLWALARRDRIRLEHIFDEAGPGNRWEANRAPRYKLLVSTKRMAAELKVRPRFVRECIRRGAPATTWWGLRRFDSQRFWEWFTEQVPSEEYIREHRQLPADKRVV